MQNLTSETKKFICSCKIRLFSLSELKKHIKNQSSKHILKRINKFEKKSKNHRKILKRIGVIKSGQTFESTNFAISKIYSLANTLMLNIFQNKSRVNLKILTQTSLSININSKSKPTLKNQIIKFFNQAVIKEITKFNHLKQKNNFRFKNFFQKKTCALFSLCLSKDKFILISGGSDSKVRLWDAQTLDQIACLSYHKSTIWCLDIEKSSNFALSGSCDSSICLWNLKTRKLKNVFLGHQDLISSLKFAEDANVFFSGSTDNTIKIWKFDKPSIIYSIHTFCTISFISLINEAKKLVVVFVNGIIQKFDLNTSNRRIKKNLKQGILCCAFAEESNVLMTGIFEGYVQFIDINTLRLLSTSKAHSERVSFIDYCKVYERFATCSNDHSIKLWSSKNFTVLKVYDKLGDAICCVKISKMRIYFGGNNCQIAILNDKTTNLGKIRNFCLSVSLKLKLIAYGYDNLYFFCLKSLKNIKSISFFSEIESLCFVKSILLCGTRNGSIFMVNAKDFKIKNRFYFGKDQILFISASKDFKLMCYSTENKSSFVELKFNETILSLNYRIKTGKFSSNFFVFSDMNSDVYIYDKFEKIVKIIHLNFYQLYFVFGHKFILVKDKDSKFCFLDLITYEKTQIMKNLKDFGSYFKDRETMVYKKDAILLSLLYSSHLTS